MKDVKYYKNMIGAFQCFFIALILVGCSDSGSTTHSNEESQSVQRNYLNDGYIVNYHTNTDYYSNVVSTIDYEYDFTKRNITSRIRSDSEGKVIALFGFNSQGDLIKLNLYNDKGNSYSNQSFTRNNEGLLISVVDDGFSIDSKTEFGYKDNALDYRLETMSGSENQTNVQYHYDENGKLSGIVEEQFFKREFGDDLIIKEKRTYEYNEINQIVSYSSDYQDDGLIDHTGLYTYDEFGNVILVNHFDNEGNLLETDEYGYSPISEPVFNLYKFGELFFP